MDQVIPCECGAPLIEAVADRGVMPIGGTEWIPFRRTTDYVMCEKCLRTYGVRDLLERAKDGDVIDLLERMAAKAEQADESH